METTKLQTNGIEVFENSVLVGSVNIDWDAIATNAKEELEGKVSLARYLAKAVSLLEPRALREQYDSAQLQQNREQMIKMRDYLVENDELLNKAFMKIMTVLFGQNQPMTITQSVLVKHWFKDIDKSLKASAQAVYFLSETGIFNMKRKVTKRNGAVHTYFVIEPGDKFPLKLLDVKRIMRKLNKKNKRRVYSEPASEKVKVKRNNSKGLYGSFDNAAFAQKAVQVLRQNAIRLVIPDDISIDGIVQNIFKYDPSNPNQKGLYDETYEWLVENNDKIFYSDRTLDRALRIYGFKTLDITSSSKFRPFLRLPKKRKVTKDGAKYYKLFAETLIKDNAPKWYIDEVKSICPGSYTNILIEVDANNQGPALIAAFLEDKTWLNKYWRASDAEAIYSVFKNVLLSNLNLPLDTLNVKDVKYKIMTKAYNKTNESNIFGDKDFLQKLEEAYLKGLFLSRFDFFELPLKMQLQQKLGDEYSFTDEQLLEAYQKAIEQAAPFLEQFRLIIDKLQNSFQVKPSVYKWKAVDGDYVYSARSTMTETPVTFIDLTGTKHTITYRHATLIEQNKFGGETALSPTFIQGTDAWIARSIILKAPHTIHTNHDAFFVHGNDVEYVVSEYRKLFAQVSQYGKYWFKSMLATYGTKDKALNTMSSFAEMIGNTDTATQEDFMKLDNLVGV